MHNRALHDTLAAFVEEAAWQLAEEVSGGAEIPFELINAAPSSRGAAPLYCYRPQTQRFLAERAGALGRLPSYVPAIQGLMALPDLSSYLRARGRRPQGPDSQSHADAALQAFLTAMWTDSTEFEFNSPRFAAAFAELEEAVYEGCELALVVTPVEGLVIESEEVALGDGLRLVRGIRLQDAPPELRARRVRDGRRADARGGGPEPRACRPAPAAAADRAPPVGRRRAGTRTDGVGAHGRRAVAGDPARDRPAPAERRLPARVRGGGPAARFLLPDRAPHAARRRARLGAAAVRARLRARAPRSRRSRTGC